MSGTRQATTALDQAVAIQHRMNRGFGGDGDVGEPPDQALADLTGAPTGVFALHVQDKVLHLKRELMSIAIGAAASVRQPLNAAFLIAIEDLVAGFAGNSELPAELGHRLASQPASHKLQTFIQHRTPLSMHHFPPHQKGKTKTYVSHTTSNPLLTHLHTYTR